jgi:hypothetical protein
VENASAPSRPAVAWSWQGAIAGAVYALPAGIVALRDPSSGLSLAVGVLPAAILPMPARRRSRVAILVVGAVAGVSMFLGGMLAHLPVWLAAVLLVPLVTGAAALSAVAPGGRLVLSLCAPLVAVGLSFSDFATSVVTVLLLVAGAAYAWLVSLCWPERPPAARAEPARPEVRSMVGYGLRLGAAAAIAYAVAAGLGTDHPGWAPGACLLVARPQVDLLRSRGVARVVAVLVGASAAVALLALQPPSSVYAAVVLLTLAGVAGTAGSRWYITAGFSTLLVLVLLVYGDEAQTAQKVGERVGETVLGVGLAYLFGWLLPSMRRR